jgi:hypothetical protein
MQAIIRQRSANGAPGAYLSDVAERLPDVSFSRRALWGPFSATLSWDGTREEGYRAADWLGSGVEVVSPDGDALWSGLIWSVGVGTGQRRRTRSLEGYANRVRVLWNNDGAQGSPIVADDTAGQASYGVYEYVHNAGRVDAFTASNLATQQLSLKSRLLYLPESSGSGITIECVGWYQTLGNLTYTSATTGTADVAVVIKDVLTASAPLITADYSQIQTTGATVSQTFDTYETPLEIIRRLVDSTTDYVFGIGPGRVPYLRPSNRLSATPHYRELATGVIEDVAGAIVAPYLVQADRVVRQVDLAPVSLPLTAIDSIESVWLAEVSYSSTAGMRYRATIAGEGGQLSAY